MNNQEIHALIRALQDDNISRADVMGILETIKICLADECTFTVFAIVLKWRDDREVATAALHTLRTISMENVPTAAFMLDFFDLKHLIPELYRKYDE